MARTPTKTPQRRSARKSPKKNPAPITLDHLPPDLVRNRVLGTAEAAAFNNVSVPHWRRLYRAGTVPKPIRISARKYGWTIGTLIDLVKAREAE
jgi:prophage regulatory protein